MKREALRTESETSHRVMSFGFSRCRRRKRTSMGMPPYWRLFRMVRRESSRPFSSCRWRRARASLILRGKREERLVGEHLAGETLARAVGAPLELALHVLADHPAEGLEAEVEVVADAGEHARIHALGLQELHDAGEVALDGRPVELVVDLPREVADLEEVHQP